MVEVSTHALASIEEIRHSAHREGGFFILPRAGYVRGRHARIKGEPFTIASEQEINRRLIGYKLVRFHPPSDPPFSLRSHGREQRQAGPNRPKLFAVGDMDLHAAAKLAGELVE